MTEKWTGRYAVAHGFIVTADDDGNIPLNSRVIATIGEPVTDSMRDEMLQRANAAPALVEALEAVVAIADRDTEEFERARAALRAARGEE